MKDVLTKLGKQTPIYLLGMLAGRLAGFLMLPIYTAYLTPADYGVLELLSLTVEAIGILGAAGLSAGVLKFHAQYGGATDKREVLSTAALGIAGVMSIVAALGIALSGPLNNLVLGEVGQPVLFRMFFAIYLLQQMEIVPLLLLRIQGRPLLFVGINLAKLILMLSLNVWLVVVEGQGVLGVLTSNLVASSLFATGSMGYLFATVGGTFSAAKFWEMLRFGLPMMFWFFGNFILVSSDRFFLNHFAGAREVGIYSLAYRFMAILPALTFVPFFQAWDPQRFELASKDGAGETFTNVFTYLNLAVASVALGIALFTEDVLRLMADQDFHSAYRVVPILLAAQILWSMVGYVNLGLLLRNRTERLGAIALATVAIVISLNYVLVPVFGIMGAASAMLAGYAVRFVAVLAMSQRHYRIRYDWPRLAYAYGIVIGAVAIKLAVPSPSIVASGFVGILLFGIASLTIYLVVLSADERAHIGAVGPLAWGLITGRTGR